MNWHESIANTEGIFDQIRQTIELKLSGTWREIKRHRVLRPDPGILKSGYIALVGNGVVEENDLFYVNVKVTVREQGKQFVYDVPYDTIKGSELLNLRTDIAGWREGVPPDPNAPSNSLFGGKLLVAPQETKRALKTPYEVANWIEKYVKWFYSKDVARLAKMGKYW